MACQVSSMPLTLIIQVYSIYGPISNFYQRTSQLYGAKNSGENLNDKKCQWTRPTIRAQGTRTKRPIRTHHAYYSHETRPYSCFHLESWYRRLLAVRLY